MAKYDMNCEKCGHAEEHDRPMSDGPPKSCPKCRSKRYKQVLHPVNVRAYYSPMHPRHNRGNRGRS